MRHVIDRKKEKAIIVTTTSLISLLGLEALSEVIGVYQPAVFLLLALLVYLVLIFKQAFVFDLHIKRTTSWKVASRSFWEAFGRRFHYMTEVHHYLHFQNYLILPGIVYWSTVALIFINPFDQLLKQAWIVLSSLALSVIFWYLKTVFYSHKTAGQFKRQAVFLVKLYAAYIAFAATFGVMRFFGYEPEFFAVAIFALTFLLVYQAMFQHHFIGFQTLKFLLFLSAVMGLLAILVFLYWNVNYFSGALVLAAVYNTLWGLIHHHYIDKNLNRVITYEYLAVLFLVLVIVFSLTNFQERI